MSKGRFKIPIKIGQKFGQLTIIKEVKPQIDYRGYDLRIVLCKCDCGNIKKINYYNLRSGSTKSCGCQKKKNLIRTTHGMTGTKFYDIFNGIKTRCFNKNDQTYKDYGGRGITVCDRWLEFENFKDDMYPSYKEHKLKNDYTSIDRIKNNGNYCKGNCRWATRKEQNNNTRKNCFITYKRQTLTIAQWAEKSGINYWTLKARINRHKWSVKKALLTKINII